MPFRYEEDKPAAHVVPLDDGAQEVMRVFQRLEPQLARMAGGDGWGLDLYPTHEVSG